MDKEFPLTVVRWKGHPIERSREQPRKYKNALAKLEKDPGLWYHYNHPDSLCFEESADTPEVNAI